MEFEQKLEIAFGVLTLVAALILFIIASSSTIELATYRRESIYQPLIEGFIVFLLPTAILAFCSILHAKGRSPFALASIVAGGALVIVIFALAFLHYAVFAGLKWAAIFGSPALLSMITIVLAFRTRKSLALY